MEEAVSHWSGKSFKHRHSYMSGKQRREPGVQMYKSYCAKKQHAKHANARGSGGMPPQEIFEKFVL